MTALLEERLQWLRHGGNLFLLRQGLHGVERECLRVDRQGALALTPHPEAFGRTLTHPEITTDYSESLLEFITPPRNGYDQALEELDRIHRFVYSELQDETLWSASMPCLLPEEERIPIACYGNSLVGMSKHVYRRGLAVRYGKTMQCIAGIHYNYSLSEPFWRSLQQHEGNGESAGDYQSAGYIALIRNFCRFSWLLMYLFGSSPALDRGFLRGHPHQLQALDEQTLYLPWATSLRMSDLGYQNKAQAGLTPCYNDLDSYIRSLCQAVSTPWPAYEEIGLYRDGERIQLNTHILQIENEYYSSIRPKRVIQSGERPVHALRDRGVQYIEVRCLDIDPFLPLGMDRDTAAFLDCFLLFCALEQSPLLLGGACERSTRNFLAVVNEGRRPGLELVRDDGPVVLHDWALQLLDDIAGAAQVLDASLGGDVHTCAVQAQRSKVENPALTPSARVLERLRDHRQSFVAFSLEKSCEHADYFRKRPLNDEDRLLFQSMAQESVMAQNALEQACSDDSFEEYLSRLGID